MACIAPAEEFGDACKINRAPANIFTILNALLANLFSTKRPCICSPEAYGYK